MIQPLRTVHRRAFVALACALPAILVVGLGARRPVPSPAADRAQMPATATLVLKSDALWPKHSIGSEFYRDSNRPQEIYVVLAPAQDLAEPDLLLYWASSEPQGNTLPSGSRLLGGFVPGRAFVLPQDDVANTGHLVLYSLAHQAVVDSAVVEKLP